MNEAAELQIRRALADLLDLAPDIDSPRQSVSWEAPRRPMLVPVAAGLVAVAGLGAVVFVNRAGDESGPTATPTQTQGTVASTVTTSVPVASDDPDQVQWFLPGVLPEGYELTDITADRVVDGAPNPDVAGGFEVVGGWPDIDEGIQTWIRRGPDGVSNADTISVQARTSGVSAPTIPGGSTPEPDSALMGPVNATVHGLDAFVIGLPQRESPGWTIEWSESGMLVTILTTGGVSEDEATAIAEASIVSTDGATVDPASLPAGFEPVDMDADAPSPSNVHESVAFIVSPTAGGGSIRVSIDTAYASLDELAIDESERRAIDGVEYSMFENDDSLYSRVVWLADGRQFEAAGAAAMDDVLAVATGVRAATREEAGAAAAAITAATQALPTVGAATLADGLQVSVHGPIDDVGVVGICVDGAQPRCVRPDGVMGLLGIPGLAINAVFHIGGDRRVIAWNGTEPELSDAEAALPDLVAAATGIGWFVDRRIPAGQPLQGISFRADDGSLTGVVPTDALRP